MGFVDVNIEHKKCFKNLSQPIYALAMSGSVILHLSRLLPINTLSTCHSIFENRISEKFQ